MGPECSSWEDSTYEVRYRIPIVGHPARAVLAIGSPVSGFSTDPLDPFYSIQGCRRGSSFCAGVAQSDLAFAREDSWLSGCLNQRRARSLTSR